MGGIKFVENVCRIGEWCRIMFKVVEHFEERKVGAYLGILEYVITAFRYWV